MNKVIMMGRMLADAELKATPSGLRARAERIRIRSLQRVLR